MYIYLFIYFSLNFSHFCFLLIYVFDLSFVNFLYLFISLFAYLAGTMIEFVIGIFVCMCWIYLCICLCIQGFSNPWSLHCSWPRKLKAKANKWGWSAATPLVGNHVWDGFGIGQFESSLDVLCIHMLWETCYLLKNMAPKYLRASWFFERIWHETMRINSKCFWETLAWNYLERFDFFCERLWHETIWDLYEGTFLERL